MISEVTWLLPTPAEDHGMRKTHKKLKQARFGLLIRFTPNLMLIFDFRPPIGVPNFSQIEACMCEL